MSEKDVGNKVGIDQKKKKRMKLAVSYNAQQQVVRATLRRHEVLFKSGW